MSDKRKSVVALAVLALTSLAVTACNTVEGAGKDVKSGGQALENSAQRNK